MELSIKDLKELLTHNDEQKGLTTMLGRKVIIRTYSAGVWYGTLAEKDSDEVILTGARRLYRWHAAKSISLSGVANYGLKIENSKVCPAVRHVWLQAIEIIPCTDVAIAAIDGAPDVEAE